MRVAQPIVLNEEARRKLEQQSREMYTAHAANMASKFLPFNRSNLNLMRCKNVQKDLATAKRTRPSRSFP
jgi:hypothetical protein